MSEMPPHLTPAVVGKACRMRTEKARRMLRRAGILERLGGAWVVGDSRLRERLPDVYERVFAYIVLEQAERRNDAQ
jgi:hypothetical protein